MVALKDGGKEALDGVVSNLVDTTLKSVPGFVLGATSSEGELYFNSGGYKVFNDPESGSIDEDAVFWICSMTKLVAHIAALQLVERGKLDPETPVSHYFPQFSNTVVLENTAAPVPSYKKAENPVLVKHLFNHSSGLFLPPDMTIGIALPLPYCGEHDIADPHSLFLSKIQGDLPGIPLQFEPGTDFAYGFSSDVLGFVVEKVSGTTLDKYMQENIFGPLNIKGSFYETPNLKERRFPLHYRSTDGVLHLWNNQPGTRIPEQDPTKISANFGGSGLFMSMRDYLKLLRHILQINDGTAESPILKKDTVVKSIFTGTLPKKGAETMDAFLNIPLKGHSWSDAGGICGVDYPGGRKKGTVFWSGWAGTHFFIDPQTGVAVVYGTQLSCLETGAMDPTVIKSVSEFEQKLYEVLA